MRAMGSRITLLLFVGMMLSACGSAGGEFDQHLTSIEDLEPRHDPAGEPLRVVASTSIVADVARSVGGDLITLDVLLPPGSDPHGLDLVPSDLRLIEGADLVLVSGFGLEQSLLNAIDAAGLQIPIVSVSEGIVPLMLDPAHADDDHDEEDEDEHTADADNVDPHVWLDPHNVMIWADNIAAALGSLDPRNRGQYEERAAGYVRQLQELDRWIAQELEGIPATDRILVSDHASLGYFARRYDFRVLGAVIPAYSTQAEPAPQELAELGRLVDEHQVAALFIDAGANRSVTAALSQDLGIPVKILYEGSLSGPAGPAGTYIELMRYNAAAIRDALSGGRDG